MRSREATNGEALRAVRGLQDRLPSPELARSESAADQACSPWLWPTGSMDSSDLRRCRCGESRASTRGVEGVDSPESPVERGLPVATIKEIVDSYRLFMEVKYPSHLGHFDARRCSERESADAEAVVFALLRDHRIEVAIGEDVSTGGADFLCKSGDCEFLTEVTCVTSASLARVSGLENRIPENGECTSFALATVLFRRKVNKKAPQLAGIRLPRLLVCVGFHVMNAALIGKVAAENLLTGDCSIQVSVPGGATSIATDLKNAGFIRPSRDGSVEACRRSISAVLLIQAHGDCCDIYGVLHPDPAVPFPIATFPKAPFVRLTQWPPHDMRLELEWMIHDPQPWRTYHGPVVLRDDELRR